MKITQISCTDKHSNLIVRYIDGWNIKLAKTAFRKACNVNNRIPLKIIPFNLYWWDRYDFESRLNCLAFCIAMTK